MSDPMKDLVADLAVALADLRPRGRCQHTAEQRSVWRYDVGAVADVIERHYPELDRDKFLRRTER